MNERDRSVTLQPTRPSSSDRLFPTLTDAQMARIVLHGGRRRGIARGEVLVEAGSKAVLFFVVVSGELEVSDSAGTVIVTHHAGQFSGEGTMLTSRPGVFAVGDVRSGNIKRCASAVGEGSNAVAFVHQVLHP